MRKILVPKDPEELVRQSLLQEMMGKLGYPSSLIAVEKSLALLPHLEAIREQIPERRADILVFGKDLHPEFSLYPLLLIECKAVPITPKVIRQATGYNRFVKSFFLAVANEGEVRTGWWNSSLADYEFIPFLPAYKDLLDFLTSKK